MSYKKLEDYLKKLPTKELEEMALTLCEMKLPDILDKVKAELSERNEKKNSLLAMEAKKRRFSNMCWKVLLRMLNGEKLTVHETAQHGPNHVGALAGRIKELRDKNGITEIKRDWAEINGAPLRYKWYYIPEEDRLKVAERILNIQQENNAKSKS